MKYFLVLAALLGGCVLPVAWVNPPIDASAAVAYRDGYGRGAFVGDFEAVALPLNVSEATADLPIDVAIGGRFHWANLASQRFARAEGRLTVPLILSEDEAERIKVEVSGGATLDHEYGRLDPLASVRLLWGVERFIESDGGGGCSSGDRGFVCGGGLFHGQLGGFMYAEAAWMRLGDETVWLGTAGLLVRIPAGVGAGFVVGLP